MHFLNLIAVHHFQMAQEVIVDLEGEDVVVWTYLRSSFPVPPYGPLLRFPSVSSMMILLLLLWNRVCVGVTGSSETPCIIQAHLCMCQTHTLHSQRKHKSTQPACPSFLPEHLQNCSNIAGWTATLGPGDTYNASG